MLFESYIHRLLALLFFFVVVAFVDYCIKGSESVKWRQYLTLISIAIVFSLFGAVHDQITVSISKEYYILGKGVSAENLRLGVLALGLKTGSYAGIVVGAVLLYFRLAPSIKAVVYNVIPVGFCAFCFLLIGAVVGYITHLLGYKVISTGNAAFLIVWGWHIGLYLGALLGLIYVVKKRKIT